MSRRSKSRSAVLRSVVVGTVAILVIALLSSFVPADDYPGHDYDLSWEPANPPGTLYQAHNPAQDLHAYFGEQGVVVQTAETPSEPGWMLGLELAGYGYMDAEPGSVGYSSLETNANRADYVFSDGISGSYVNRLSGIEQGFVLKMPPGGARLDGPVALTFITSGDLVGKVADATSIWFLSQDGRSSLHYMLASARSADGQQIPAHLEQLPGAEGGFLLLIDAPSDDAYPITVKAMVAKDAPPPSSSSPLEVAAPNATTLISPTGAGGFELLTGSFTDNGWFVVNHTTNTWQTGGVAVPFAGSNSAYVSNTGGAAYAFTNTSSQTSHFYRDVTVPPGESAITLSWQLKVNGESGFDRLLVYTAPITVTPVAGTPASSSTTLTGATLVFTGAPISSGTVYATQTVTLSPTLAGTMFRLIFTWQNDSSGGTNPPASVDNISLISDLPPPPPANDLCTGAIALTQNIPVSGTNANALNDYSITSPTATCFPGIPTTQGNTAVGRDTVYSFTAPTAGKYSFRVLNAATGGNPVLYLTLPAGPAYACPALGAQACTASVVGANRNASTTINAAAEEVMCQTLAADQKVYLFVDEATATTTGGAYIVQANPCIQETESNGTPGTANALGTACPIEGSINPAGDIDFFSLPATTANQRVFAMADGAAGSSNDFDMRVTTSADTLEYDDANLADPFGSLAPTADGTKATGTSTLIRMSHFSASTASEPYRLYATVRGDSSTATPETEPNESIATANSVSTGYISGTTSATADVDFFAVTAAAGDLIFVGLDSDPGYAALALATRLSLVDAANTTLVTVADGSTTSTARAPVLASLTSTTPTSNGQALAWRVATAGTYYVKVEFFGGTAPKAYLLSITSNCIPAGCVTPADCADGNVCTDDVCTAGVCSHPSNTLPCAGDGNTCTTDVCSGGSCTHPPNTDPCDDSNSCTSTDTCAGGSCTGTPNTDPCEDGNSCTTGTTCGGGICGTNNTDPCSDGNACTINDECAAGSCVPGPPPAPVQLCSTGGSITIPTVGNATPYPSPIPVSGQPPVLCKVTVNLNTVIHTFPDDIDMLLTAPGTATNAIIMSDVGGGTDVPVLPATVLNLTLDDAAATSLSDLGPLATGTFKPTNVGTGDVFSGGAPAATGGSVLSAFNGTDPNGTWNLYVTDQFSPDGGSLGNWCVNLQSVCTTDAQCDDGNVCTDDTCFRGACTHDNNTDPCTDGNACTDPDVCSGGVCVPGDNPCDDDNACTEDVCDGFGGCSYPAVDCNDGNACTDDSCNPASGCEYDNNTDPCTDGNACTINDACAGGSCVPGAPPATVQVCSTDTPLTIPSTPANSPGSPYPSNIVVGGQAPVLCKVTVNLNSVVHTFPDDLDTLLVAPGTATNALILSDVGGSIDVPNPPETVLNLTLDDAAIPSLPDAGPLASGTFKPTNVGAETTAFPAPAPAISGGSALSVFNGTDPNGTWSLWLRDQFDTDGGSIGGWCVNVQSICTTDAQCDDANGCTDDTCFRGSCTHTDNTDPCDDGDACTTEDTCGGGACVGGPSPCDDDSVCTDDSCDAGVCTNETIDCNDDNVCTDDSCNPTSGCEYANNTDPCDDDDACTTVDTCGAGSCAGGPALDCNDDNVCTDDSCNPASGCEYDSNTDPCDDGLDCTTEDTCSGGSCVGGPPPNCDDDNPCTTDGCDDAGGCTHEYNTAPCDDDDACTTNDTCNGAGTCEGGPALDCDDGEYCNGVESCDPGSGCEAGTPPDCNDTVDCTVDGCDEIGDICTHTPDDGPCDNGIFCDGAEICSATLGCQAGTPPVCNDGVACTIDTCNEGNDGCDYTPSDLACDDGDSCTADSCDAIDGCQQTNICCSDPNPMGLGYYQRLCNPPQPPVDPLTQADVDCVNDTCDFSSVATVADICGILTSRVSQCARAEAQFLNLVLNVCRGRICSGDPIVTSCSTHTTVGEALTHSDDLLCNPTPSQAECAHAACESHEINNGIAINADSLLVTRFGNLVRLMWQEPLHDPEKSVVMYHVWRTELGGGSPAFVGEADPNGPLSWVDTTATVGVSYQYMVTAHLQ